MENASAQASSTAAQAAVQAPALAPAAAGVLGGGRFVGSARLTVFGFDIYLARLWAAPGFTRQQYTQHPFALELQYLRDFKGAAIAERSLKEMRRVENFSDAQAQQWLALLTQTLPDVKKGERLMGIYLPGLGLRLLFNDQPLATWSDPALARVFMGIWLSPHTSEPALREALLIGAAP